jgi:hypothetical protein
LDTDACVILHRPDIAPSPNSILVASAWAEQALDGSDEPIDDAVEITFDNLFPCIDFMADVVFEYQGSIPVKIQLTDWNFVGTQVEIPGDGVVDWLKWMYDNGHMTFTFMIKDESGQYTIPVKEGYQLHQGAMIKLVVNIHVPQEINIGTEEVPILVQTDFLMNCDGKGFVNFQVIQWNEYED